MKKITIQWLEKNGACRTKREKFKKLFGRIAKVSYKNAEKWVKESRYWREDFKWLFWVTFAGPFKKNADVLKKLVAYLGVEKGASIIYFEDTIFKLSRKRIIHGITQIMYMASE